MYFLRRLRVYGVEQKFMILFYQAVLQSNIGYVTTGWCGNLTVQLKSQITCLAQTAMEIIGVKNQPSLQTIYEQSVMRHAKKTVTNLNNTLHPELQLLSSGKSFRVPMCRLRINI